MFGLLQLIFDGAYAWGWQSMLLDYLLAFTPGAGRSLFRGKPWGIFGTVVGCAGRFLVHYISGVTIYKILVPTAFMNWTFTSPSFYSIVYNGSYMLPNTVIALAIRRAAVQADEAVYPGTGHSITPHGAERSAPWANLTACCWSATLATPSMTHTTGSHPESGRPWALDRPGRPVHGGHRAGPPTFAPYVHLAPINAPVVLSNGSAIYDFQTETMLVQTLLDDRAPAGLSGADGGHALPRAGDLSRGGHLCVPPNAITDAHMRKVGTDYEVRDIRICQPWTKAIVQQEYDVLLGPGVAGAALSRPV